MNWRKMLVLFVVALSYPCAANAIEITGKVAAVSGDAAAIAIDGDVLPSVGNKVEVYFKIEDAEIAGGQGVTKHSTFHGGSER